MNSVRQKIITSWLSRHLRDQTQVFSKTAADIYTKILCHVASADGVFAPAERDWIIGYRAASGVSDSILDAIKNYEVTDLSWKINLNKHQKFLERAKYPLIYDAFQAASADGELHEKERKAISDVGTIIGVDEKTIEKIAKLYQDEVEIKKRRIALLFPGGVNEAAQETKDIQDS